jgi:hypothetical protein
MDQVSSSLYMDEGHCSIALPFRNKDVMFPNNSQQCLQRLNSLKGKFAKNSTFRNHYSEFMSAEQSKTTRILSVFFEWYIP